MQSCLFCDIIGKGSNLLTNTVLYEDSDFYIIPALGCLVSGYVLIVSKEHTNSMCYLSEQKKETLQNIINNLSDRYFCKYGFYPLVFEHGAKYDCGNLSGCCVLHAHMHVVPRRFNSMTKMSSSLNLKEVKTMKDFYNECTDNPYIFFMDNDKKKYISVLTGDVIPSQIIRKWIAADLGIPNEWDWRINPFNSNIFNTVVDIGYLLKGTELSKNSPVIKKVYYCRAMDGLEKDEIINEFHIIEERLKEKNIRLINIYEDNHNSLNKNKENAMLIMHENSKGIDAADCVIVNLSIKNHLYIGCIDEMIVAKERGRFVIVIAGDAGADNHFYTYLRSDLIVKTIDEAIDYLASCQEKYKNKPL
jgi:diadenosine tetraphosphate (Ap4A) HIT family hydrolase/nucleoside 2-deoxyribosyltransferase